MISLSSSPSSSQSSSNDEFYLDDQLSEKFTRIKMRCLNVKTLYDCFVTTGWLILEKNKKFKEVYNDEWKFLIFRMTDLFNNVISRSAIHDCGGDVQSFFVLCKNILISQQEVRQALSKKRPSEEASIEENAEQQKTFLDIPIVVSESSSSSSFQPIFIPAPQQEKVLSKKRSRGEAKLEECPKKYQKVVSDSMSVTESSSSQLTNNDVSVKCYKI